MFELKISKTLKTILLSQVTEEVEEEEKEEEKEEEYPAEEQLTPEERHIEVKSKPLNHEI